MAEAGAVVREGGRQQSQQFCFVHNLGSKTRYLEKHESGSILLLPHYTTLFHPFWNDDIFYFNFNDAIIHHLNQLMVTHAYLFFFVVAGCSLVQLLPFGALKKGFSPQLYLRMVQLDGMNSLQVKKQNVFSQEKSLHSRFLSDRFFRA